MIVMADLFASTSGLDSTECIRIPAQLCKNRGTRGNQAWGAYREAQGSAAALLIMEDISLPTRCKGSLGHGEDAIYQS